jgi:hypothetical protein
MNSFLNSLYIKKSCIKSLCRLQKPINETSTASYSTTFRTSPKAIQKPQIIQLCDLLKTIHFLKMYISLIKQLTLFLWYCRLVGNESKFGQQEKIFVEPYLMYTLGSGYHRGWTASVNTSMKQTPEVQYLQKYIHPTDKILRHKSGQ